MKLQNKLYILILIGIFVFFPNFVNAYLYDDFSGEELNLTLWNVEGDLDEYYLGVIEENFHTAQLTTADRYVTLTILDHEFVAGDVVEYDLNYVSGEGNRINYIDIDSSTSWWGVVGYWNAIQQGGNEFGIYHYRVEFTENDVNISITRPNNETIQIVDFPQITGSSHTFGVGTRTGHNGIVHMDYDNFYINEIGEELQCGDTIYENTVLTNDLLDCPEKGLIIGIDDIILNCNGHLIDGDVYGSSAIDVGIYLNNKNGVTIQNCNIEEFPGGIRFESGSNNILTGNIINNNMLGIYLNSSFNNDLYDNIIHNNSAGAGISLLISSNNLLFNNNINNNSVGITLYMSPDNQISNNNITENSYYDIRISVESESECNNIIEDNVGSGNRPIRYFNSSVNLENEVFSELILCNADNSNINNIIVSGSETLKNNGIHLLRTENTDFTNINSSNNQFGIELDNSSNNNIIDSNLNYNNYGVALWTSPNNQILNNNIKENSDSDIGIGVDSDSDCDNTIENNIGSGERPIAYFNSTVNFENEIVSELILCNADNSNINNVKIIGSDVLQNNGFVVKRTYNSEFTNIISSNNYNGIQIDSSPNNVLTNSITNNNRYLGILIGSNSNNTFLKNNTANSNFYNGIRLNSDNNKLLTNIANSNNNNGIVLGSSSSDNIVDNNIANNNPDGISLGPDSNNNTITNNIVRNNTNKGIGLFYSSYNNIINNDVKNNNNGIQLFYSSNNILSNNDVNNNEEFGVYLYIGSDNTLSDNTINDHNFGIYLGGTSNNDVSNNNIENNGYDGIWMSNSSNNEISSNEFLDNNHGIYLDYTYSEYNTFWNNIFINNNINAYESELSNNNNWNLSEEGNYWDDFETNSGYPNYYEIDGSGDGIDYHPSFVEYYVDNSDSEFVILSGEWNSRHHPNAYNGEANFNNQGFGLEKAGWKISNLVYPGTYDVYVWKFEHPYLNLMANNTHYMIYHRTGTSNWILVNQQTTGNEWIYLGEFEFDNSHGQGIMITDEANGIVVADAVKLVYQGPLSNLDSYGPDLFDFKVE